ncbi:MAG TPA: hypothetical protein VMU17_06050, partial [Elusimicrobiota bacterium]|nr:hypothetical protein [Elusimicrobiota bacterium]
ALWSPTPGLSVVSSAPIVAAGWGGKEIDSWLAEQTHGEPPSSPQKALAKPISYFQPAIALKLIPAGVSHPIRVKLIDWKNGTPAHLRPVIWASVEGESVDRSWIEYRLAGDESPRAWKKIGRPVWKAPYQFSLDFAHLPTGTVQLRVAASNIWEERGESEPFTIQVAPLPANPGSESQHD